MALSFAESATRSLLGKLGSILSEEAAFLGGVEKDILFMMDELNSMAAFLRVLSSRQDHDEQVKAWMKQVREMAYDAEDSIDVFKYRLQRPHHEHGFMGCLTHSRRLSRTLKARHILAADLQELRLRARDVSERRARYSITTLPSDEGASSRSGAAAAYYSSSVDPRRSAIFIDPVQLVGINEPRDQLIGWLMDVEQHHLGVISLVGFGGLGKTTLAKMVYESPAITSGHFQARAWISVSQTYNMEALLRTMLQELSIKVDDAKGEAKMAETIRDYLKERRYLIVIDDIWTITAWENIKVAFPDNSNGSRIIVTTRIKEVANTCSSHNHHFIYEIPPLKDEQSWELFCKRVFIDQEPKYTCPDNLKKPTEDILKKCGGLPLAIVTIAGLLASKPKKTPEEWQKLLHHLGPELETNASLEKISHILLLSYNALPHYLKPCLLYLSIFPEDYNIKRKRLMRRWVAEGLVSGRRGMSEEEVAEGYFYELINRSLIQPSEISVDGKVKYCRVHDIMLELIVSKSAEENCVTIVGEDTASMPAQGKIRRLSLHRISINVQKDHDLYLSHVRSLTTVDYYWGPLQDYGRVRLLRVLDLEGCRRLCDDGLKNIDRLFLLSYLSLRDTRFKHLPYSIGDLQKLQFLDVRGTRVRKLPSSIVKLQRLACLLGWGLSLPKGVGKMKGLRNCGRIDGNSHGLREIGELAQLKNLKIRFEDNKERVMGIFCRSQKFVRQRQREHLRALLHKLNGRLRSLTITDLTDEVIKAIHDVTEPQPLHLEKISLYGKGMETLPTWFASLNQLAKITLQRTYLKRGALQVLKDLPALAQLLLNLDSFARLRKTVQESPEQAGSVEQQLEEPLFFHFGCDGFRVLKLLHIVGQGLPGVSFEEGALPNLESLIVVRPDDIVGLEHLSQLKEVRLETNNRLLKDKFNEIVEKHPNHPKSDVIYSDHLLISVVL